MPVSRKARFFSLFSVALLAVSSAIITGEPLCNRCGVIS